eukprot:scaffold22239_cov17-Prasinocladus_malaysianus.AAC.1
MSVAIESSRAARRRNGKLHYALLELSGVMFRAIFCSQLKSHVKQGRHHLEYTKYLLIVVVSRIIINFAELATYPDLNAAATVCRQVEEGHGVLCVKM